jgi:hypothetical protein
MWPSESTSTLKIEAEDSSKMFITTHKTTLCHKPKSIHINFHHCENLVSYGTICRSYTARGMTLLCLKGFIKQRVEDWNISESVRMGNL